MLNVGAEFYLFIRGEEEFVGRNYSRWKSETCSSFLRILMIFLAPMVAEKVGNLC